MNNKGQSLIFFLMILPVLVIFLFLIISRLTIEFDNNHNKSIINDTLKIILKDDIRDSEKVSDMIKTNIDYQTLDIDITDNYINISISIKNNNLVDKTVIKYRYCGNYETKDIINKLCV
ncbi:MAG: hypothetical protein J6X02_01645 [Bacilli bacterium]|nr:hypothetical protein [Bacilli bacterium]